MIQETIKKVYIYSVQYFVHLKNDCSLTSTKTKSFKFEKRTHRIELRQTDELYYKIW